MSDDFIFTSESNTAGHPDKLCDRISDAIVDSFLRRDPNSAITAECAVSSGVMFIAARYASMAKLDIPEVARRVIREVGYPQDVFDADACTIMTSYIDQTSSDYRPTKLEDMTESAIDRITARNQVTVFGYACNQTDALLPLPIWLAHRLAATLNSPKVQKGIPYLLPDAQSQAGIEYRDGRPERVHSITLVTSQTAASAGDAEQLRSDLIEHVVMPAFKGAPLEIDEKTQININPEGPVIDGGPAVHSGLTGRKTGSDTYGEFARHSGAALSGKDPMRIDRVGAYAARHAARNVLDAGLATTCEVQLSYSVGMSAPVSVRVRSFGTGTLDDNEITSRVREAFDFRVGAIVRDFNLKNLPAKNRLGFYEQLAVYGQMGRTDLDIPWEQSNKADALK